MNGGYLVLSRKKDESVFIGPDIEVRVLEIRGDKIRLGFRVPKEVQIVRDEVLRATMTGGGRTCDTP